MKTPEYSFQKECLGTAFTAVGAAGLLFLYFLMLPWTIFWFYFWPSMPRTAGEYQTAVRHALWIQLLPSFLPYALVAFACFWFGHWMRRRQKLFLALEVSGDDYRGNPLEGGPALLSSVLVPVVLAWPLLEVLRSGFKLDILLYPILLGAPLLGLGHIYAIDALKSRVAVVRLRGKRALWIMWASIGVFLLLSLLRL